MRRAERVFDVPEQSRPQVSFDLMTWKMCISLVHLARDAGSAIRAPFVSAVIPAVADLCRLRTAR